MSSPATVTEYGKYIDLQSYTAPLQRRVVQFISLAPQAGLLRTNVGISASGSVTAVGSFIIGSADMSEADLEKLTVLLMVPLLPAKQLLLTPTKMLLASVT